LKAAFSYGIEAISSLFFPKVCAGCGTDITGDEIICIPCMHNLPVTNYHMHSSNPVEKIFWGRVPLLTAFSYLYFNKHSIVQSLLHQLKYQSNQEVGLFFGRQIGKAILNSNRYNDLEYLIPLPLHPSKQKKRGYNQAEMICDGISEILHIPVNTEILVRPVKNETQTHKSRMERWENTSGKFSISKKEKLEGKHIMLVDDVVTTGATLEVSAAMLLTTGCRLSIGTLAYTLL